jgi:drug/metabolite transporter (DMT)-like permease
MIPLLAQAAQPKHEPLSVVLGMVFLGCLLFVILYFRFSRNTTFKRKAWPVFVVLYISSFVVAFISSMAISGKWRWDILGFLIPMAILIGFLMIRRTRFCASCGRTSYRQPIFSRRGFCPYCGAQLQ